MGLSILEIRSVRWRTEGCANSSKRWRNCCTDSSSPDRRGAQRGRLAAHGSRSNVDKIRELLDRERQQLADADKLRLSHQAELEMIAEKALRSKKRQEQARNNRETEATTRELEVLKREKEERTAEADRLAHVVVEVNASIVRHEGDFA